MELLGTAGATCSNCYAYIGATLTVELECTREFVKHFKIQIHGLVALNMDLDVDLDQLIGLST